jgi:hypothetical protein
LEKISIKTLNEYLPVKFSELVPKYLYKGYGDTITNDDEIIFELNNAGLNYIGDLDNIVPKNFIKLIKEHNININYLGILRLLLIITNLDSYLEYYAQYYINDWDIESMESLNEFLIDYGITYSYIQKFLGKKEM